MRPEPYYLRTYGSIQDHNDRLVLTLGILMLDHGEPSAIVTQWADEEDYPATWITRIEWPVKITLKGKNHAAKN